MSATEPAAALPLPTLLVSSAVTPTDHGKVVVLAAWICFTAGVLLSVARAYIRWPLDRLAGKDDAVYAVATVLAIIQTAVTINAVDRGFGKTEIDLSPAIATSVAKTIYATDLIFMLSIWAGRLSVAFLFTRLAGESHKSRLGNMLVGLQACLAVICLLVMALRQNTSQPWEYTGSTTARWIVTGIISILADLTVAAASINLVWDLEMQAKSKWLVITAFTMRMFVLPVTIIRLVSLNGVRYSDLSFSYNLPESLIQLEMYCSLVATTLPCLRLFLTAWNTSFMNVGLQVIDPQAYSEHVTSHSDPNSQGSTNRSHARKPSTFSSWKSPTGRGKSKAFVETGNRDEGRASESSETAIVVKRTVDISDERERQQRSQIQVQHIL